MRSELFSTLGEPKRLQIIQALQADPLSVGQLVQQLDMPQPTVSKHLKVLRDAGIVSCDVMAQRRIYHLESEPFKQLNSWLQPYLALWDSSLVALEKFLDQED